MRIKPRPGCSTDSVPQFVMNVALSSASVAVTSGAGGSGRPCLRALAVHPAYAREATASLRPSASRSEDSPRVSLPTEILGDPKLAALTAAASSLGTVTRTVVVTGSLKRFLL
jgi:hypothetical protein